MTDQIDIHLNNLRDALLELKPSGGDGFEGLLAAVLTELCGQPFRLASSGAQRGRDGDSAFDAGAVYFEAKRYAEDVPKKEVAVKLMDIRADREGQVDTWIIGSTAEVPALAAKDFHHSFEEAGIGLVILDWSNNAALPALATAIVASAAAAGRFLASHLTEPTQAAILAGAMSAIDYLAIVPEYSTQSNMLRQTLRNPSVGLGMAKRANAEWLDCVLSSSVAARQHFGQPLAPDDKSLDFRQPRPELVSSLLPAFGGPPRDAFAVVIGQEGVGKSWLVVNTWRGADPASILIFASASELRDPGDMLDIEGFLIRKLVAQTGDVLTEARQERWRRRFDSWRANQDCLNARLTLCIDGLNQNSSYPWGRWIPAATRFLRELGANLVVTTRASHFQTIRDSLAAPAMLIEVHEWTAQELDGILLWRGIDPKKLIDKVYGTLRNPRILGIALTLLDAHEIERAEQLSVGRLLFEHLRTAELHGSESLRPKEFAKALSDLAEQFVGRISSQQQDDLRLFDSRGNDRLSKIAFGRFFNPVGDDPDSFEISDEGLRISLAIWLVDVLEKERRNGRDPYQALDSIFEPIAALDDSAEIIAYAIEVGCLRNLDKPDAVSALVRYFLGLQNIPEEWRESFNVLVKKRPGVFLSAAGENALAGGSATYSDWLEVAILKARGEASVRAELMSYASRWLSSYSIAPEKSMFRSLSHDPPEIVEEERTKRIAEVSARLEGLTTSEKAIVRDRLHRRDVPSLAQQHRLAFTLLAGLPLEGVARVLFYWCIGDAISSDLNAPNEDFRYLLRFNRVDWQKTRSALHEAIAECAEPRSEVGGWAVVKALWGTGNSSDAERAEEIYDFLTKDRGKFKGGRTVEILCDSDPCDPASTQPTNIEPTAARYRTAPVKIDTDAAGGSLDTFFFERAMPGLARFDPSAGIEGINKLATEVLSLSGLDKHRGVTCIAAHGAVLGRSIVDRILAAAAMRSGHCRDDEKVDDEWIISQFLLGVAMPHLSGDEQMRFIDKLDTRNLSLELLDALEPADPQLVELLLEEAFSQSDKTRLLRILAAVLASGAQLTSKSLAIVAELLDTENRGLRIQALGIAATTTDDLLLRRVVANKWSRQALTPHSDAYELWYGSAALVEAAARGMIEADDLLDRLSIGHFGFAASRLGSKVASVIADRIEIALGKILRMRNISEFAAVELGLASASNAKPPSLYLRERPLSPNSREAFERFAETDEQLKGRYDRLHKAYTAFYQKLTDAEANVAVTDFTAAGMAAIVTARPDVVAAWHSLLVGAPLDSRSNLHFFAIQFAGAIAGSHPEIAVEVFGLYSGVEPVVRHVSGLGKVPLEPDVLWANAGNPQIMKICVRRLDGCYADREIATEVLSACKQGKAGAIESYIRQLSESGEPADVARAITVAGFMSGSQFAAEFLETFADRKGFLGEVSYAARQAYARDKWSRHWFELITSAASATDFWRYMVLLSKIVDGRMDLWNSKRSRSAPFDKFMPAVGRALRERIAKSNDRRKDKLFGGKIPGAIFLGLDP